MDEETKEKLMLILFVVAAFIGIAYAIMHPQTYTDLPIEKRIQYENMIFP